MFPPPDQTDLFLDKYLQSTTEDTSSEVQEDGGLFPSSEKTEHFLDKYLQLVIEDISSSSQFPSEVLAEVEVSPFWNEILSVGGFQQKRKEWPEAPSDNSQPEQMSFDSSPEPVDLGVVLNSSPEPLEREVVLDCKMTEPDDNFTEREQGPQERIEQTADIAREIVEEVLKRCELQITVRSLLAEIIAAALKVVAEKVCRADQPTPGGGGSGDDGTLDSSQEEIFSLSPDNIARANQTRDPSGELTPVKIVKLLPASQEDMFSSLSPSNIAKVVQTRDLSGELTPDKIVKPLPASQEDMFSSQASSVDEETAVVSSLLTPISAGGDGRADERSEATNTTTANQIRQLGRIVPLVPYTPSSGESSSASDLEEVADKLTEEREDVVRTQPGDDLCYQTDLFCLNAGQMKNNVQRLSNSNESFLTVSSGELCSQESAISLVEEIKSPIQIPVENCQGSEEEQREESSGANPASEEEMFELVPRRICQTYKFIPDQEEESEVDRAREDLAYKPVTSFFLRKKKKMVEASSSATKLSKEKPNEIPLKYILIQNWLMEHEEFVVHLEKSKELIIHDMPNQNNAAHILVGPMSGIFLLNSHALNQGSIRDIYRECSQSLRELWLLCIGSYEVYMQCIGVSYQAAGSGCKVFPLLLNDNIQSIAHWVIQLSRKQIYQEIRPHLRDGSTNHEVMLVKMFPCLNSLSAKHILSKMKFMDFLRLQSAEELSSHFPWLSQSAVRSIQHVRLVRLSSRVGQ